MIKYKLYPAKLLLIYKYIHNHLSVNLRECCFKEPKEPAVNISDYDNMTGDFQPEPCHDH